MKTLGFYPYQRFSVDSAISADSFTRKDFATFIRETVFEYCGDGWTFLVSRDGLVQYHCLKLDQESARIEKTWEDIARAESFEPVWQTYLAHLNILYFLLECSMHLNTNICALEFFELNYLDTTRITYEENKAIRQANYGGLNLDEMIRHGSATPKDENEFRRFVLPRAVLNDLCSYYLSAIIVDEEKTQSLLPVAKALSEHNLRNYDIALVLCWFVAERYIHSQWNKLISNKTIAGKRKDKLQGRDYTASVKTEILELNGLLSASRYEALNATRTVRNGIAHQFGRRHATQQESTAALTLVREIIEETMSLKFPFHTGGVPVHGV